MSTPTIKRINKSKDHNINNMTSTTFEFYSKILPIKQLWNYEINNIINKGCNGYSNIKYKEINIDQGNFEVEGESTLYLYGNCLKILKQNEYYEKINTLSFSYFCYDFIMSKKILKYIKEFKNLINIKFNHNNIYSSYQLLKLENLDNLEKLSINDNEICNGYLLKYFILYRLKQLKYYNNRLIKQSDILLSKKIFDNFDQLISLKEKEENQNNNKDNRNNNSILIKNNVTQKNNEGDINNFENNINNIILFINKNGENVDNYIKEENKNKFYNFAKFNLSIAIEKIIQDEENSDM